MKVTISFQQLEHTPSLDERIKEKSQKLEKFFDGKGHARWSCYLKDNAHFAELDFSGLGHDFHAKAKSENMYKCIDLAMNKIEKQICKKQGKLKNKLHRKSGELEIMDYETAWSEHEEFSKESA